MTFVKSHQAYYSQLVYNSAICVYDTQNIIMIVHEVTGSNPKKKKNFSVVCLLAHPSGVVGGTAIPHLQQAYMYVCMYVCMYV